ncbi:MAG: hypothetical protein Q8L98_07850 [Chlamydiales bacterium]|nr:hypothetical protein [Chlamydiales bacterium]
MPTDPIRRLPPPSPSSSKDKADEKKFREEMQKIEKVREVDPDEQSRKRRDQLAFELDKNKSETISTKSSSLLPSPLDVNFYKAEKEAKQSRGGSSERSVRSSADYSSSTPVPSPAYSPAPTVQNPTPAPKQTSSQSLPNSPVFWQTTDLSTNDIEPEQNFSEPPNPQIRTATPAQNNEAPDEDDRYEYVYQPEPSPEAGINKEKHPSSRKSSLAPSETNPEPTKEKKTSPLREEKPSAHKTSETELPKPSSITPSKSEQAQTAAEAQTPLSKGDEESMLGTSSNMPMTSRESALSQKSEEKTAAVRPAGEKFPPVSSLQDQTAKDQEKGEGQNKKSSGEAIPAVVSQFTPDIQGFVQSAASALPSYASHETAALWQQMVGTIYVATSRPGISTTTVTLDSAAFTGSKFFGSTITIDKYATAPNALNISLSGSPEAVSAFNQSLPTLATAFKQGNFPFTVQLKTSYRADKPVFHRKEKEDLKDSKDRK